MDSIRGVFPVECVERADSGGVPRLRGYFVRYNEWAEIDSPLEGHFREQFAPGAFTKTLQERSDQVRVLFQHGKDPQIGLKPIAHALELQEDNRGVQFEADLLDTDYVRGTLLPGLQAGVYGLSFRFGRVKADERKYGTRSDDNPSGLPEVVHTESLLREFGPVTFPAYSGPRYEVRSLSGLFLDRSDYEPALGPLAEKVDRLASELQEMKQRVAENGSRQEPAGTPASKEGASEESRRQATPSTTSTKRYRRGRSGILP